jgi:hypothetical protein
MELRKLAILLCIGDVEKNLHKDPKIHSICSQFDSDCHTCNGDCQFINDKNNPDIVFIDFGKLDTGCDNCNTDICRLGDIHYGEFCYFQTGPRLMTMKKDCKCCPKQSIT